MVPFNDPLYDNQYEQILKELEAIVNEEDSPQLISAVIEKIKILEEFSLDKKRFFCLFDQKQFQPVYLSANVAIESGYSLETFYNSGLRLLLKQIHWKQITLFYKMIVWGRRFGTLIGKHTSTINNKAFFSGIKFKDKWGIWRTFFIKQKMLRVTNDNKVSLSFLELEEITSIYKGDFVWAKMTNKTDNKFYSRVYFSNGAKKEHRDLLSDRELEILQLIVQKKSSKEIGEELSISTNTVLRHRKNMIGKVGITDMTALIHICKLCQIL